MNDRWPISYSQLAHVSLSALDRASSAVKGVLRWSRKPAHFAVSAAIIGIIGGSAYALAGLIADEGRQAIEAVPLAGAGAEGSEFTFILQAKEQDTLDGYERDLTVSDVDRNIEMGLLVRDQALAASVSAHFRGLIDRKLLNPLPTT